MLKIWVDGFKDNCIKNPNGYFNMMKKPDWFNRADIKEVIKEIDNTIAVKDEYLESPVYGGMAPERLSGGCKAVILMYIDPLSNVYASKCGDNCVPAILRLADKTDVIITLHHAMTFPDKFEAEMLDLGIVVHSMEEFMVCYLYIEGDLTIESLKRRGLIQNG